MNEQVIDAAVRAELTDRLMEAHKRFTFDAYRDRFGWDPSEGRAATRHYHSMGGVVGLLQYCSEREGDVDREAASAMVVSGSGV